MSQTQLHRDIGDDIKLYGRSVMCISPDASEDARPFAYTIGNALVGLPELLIIGTLRGELLNDLSQMMLDRGRGFDDDEVVELGGCSLKIVTADDGRAQRDYTIQAGQHLGREDYIVQQVLLPDLKGHFPDESDYSVRHLPVPVLRRARLN